MSIVNNAKVPSPEEIQRDVREFLKDKYGDKIHVPPEPNAMGNEPDNTSGSGTTPPVIHFDLKPTELESYLQQYVVGQDDAIEVLATKICTHFNRMKLENSPGGISELVGNIKSNILMIGPTGVGKTFIIKLIAKKVGVPFVKGDATKFSETGYVGGDVEDLVRNLVHEANGDIKLAEYGIIYLDEIDKIASSGSHFGPDVSRSGVQRNLLKLMEEAEVDLKTPHDLAAQMEAAMEAQRTGKVKRKKINTKNILFVTSGAFFQLADIIRKRCNQQPLGFKNPAQAELENDYVDVLKKVRSEDLINFGFESEFVGRLPVVVTLNDLDVNGLYEILRSPNSTVILGKKRDFQSYGIKINFKDDALYRIAELAFQEHTGARGLVSVVDRLLLKFEKTLPDTDINEFTVTRAVIENPAAELKALITDFYVKKFQKRFLATNGIVITFTEPAKQLLQKKAEKSGRNFADICNDLFKDYEYGLRLLSTEEFTVDEETVLDPKTRLEGLIKKSYVKGE
ncbi:AAA family ATPase [candidate division KSB1 bacterium]|nr:AAA family ATPase [candidate division KSB1 bacterium]